MGLPINKLFSDKIILTFDTEESAKLLAEKNQMDDQEWEYRVVEYGTKFAIQVYDEDKNFIEYFRVS